jgi:6-phosphogluconolactonase
MASPLTGARALIVEPDAEAASATAARMFFESSPRRACLAGGETPRRAYELLAEADFPWDQTEIFLTDERCVPPGHPASNWRMLNESLLSKVNATAFPIQGELPPDEAAAAYQEVVRGHLPFDFLLLGLGADGHVASLFPGHDQDPHPGALAAASWSKETGMWRITLTHEALSQSKRTVFLVTGEEKQSALQRLMRDDPIPAAKITSLTPITVIADQAAAAAFINR